MGDFNKALEYIESKINHRLDDVLSGAIFPSDTLLEATRYSTLVGGKRFRPAIMYYQIDLFNNIAEEVIIDIGVSIELIHTYTLIHDDLPCMDDDDMRRGKLSNHKKFNEYTAVLTGDALQSEAFYLLSSEKLHLSDKIKLNLINFLAKIAGGRNLISGQMLDLDFEAKLKQNTLKTEEILQQINLLKTAKLIALCCAIPSIVADKRLEEIDLMFTYGEKIGVIYQIVDDFIDKDDKNKVNIVNILGETKAKELLHKLNQESIDIINKLRFNKLSNINDFILRKVTNV